MFNKKEMFGFDNENIMDINNSLSNNRLKFTGFARRTNYLRHLNGFNGYDNKFKLTNNMINIFVIFFFFDHYAYFLNCLSKM